MILRAAILVASLALLTAAAQTWRLSDLRDRLADAERDFGQCSATLTAYLEGEAIDNAIPDDLDGYDPRPEWLLDPPPGPATP